MKLFNRYAGKISFLSVILAAMLLSGSISTFASTHPGKSNRAVKTTTARAKAKPRKKSKKRRHHAVKAKTAKTSKTTTMKRSTPAKKS